MRTNNKGFTLTEIVVTCLIIVIVVGLVIPGYLTQVEESKGSKALETLHVIRSAQLIYLGEYGNFTSQAASLQKYSPFPVNDGDWSYAINTGATDFTITATRLTGGHAGSYISINDLSEVDYNGTLHTGGGKWPP